jgi:RNA polymerase sigma factor (sigma-70 family)
VSKGKDTSDEDLLDAWRGGDDDAGDRLVARHFDAVYRFFWGREHENLSDLIQRTFLASARTRDRIPEGVPFRAYLLGIARIELLAHRREIERARRLIEPGSVSGQSPTTSPSANVARKEEQWLLLRALRRLPLDLQLTLELFYWEDMKVREIAVVLGVPDGTIKSRLARARELLEKKIRQLARSSAAAESTIEDLEAWARSIRSAIDDGRRGGG